MVILTEICACFFASSLMYTPFKYLLRTVGEHTSRPACAVFIGRFRILVGGARFRIFGGQGGPNSQQAHYVVLTSMRRNDVASTSFRRHVPTRFLINQCQIITFFILKSDNIENSRELKGIVLQVPSNQIKVIFMNYFALQLVTFVIFSCFT